jgi:hypothetical protein
MQSSSEARRGKVEAKIAWWSKQAAQLERDRAQLKWILVVGLPLVAPATWYHWLLGLAVLATVLVTWGTGHYMVVVRRFEYRDQLREAQGELERVQGEAGSASL